MEENCENLNYLTDASANKRYNITNFQSIKGDGTS